MEKCLFCNIVSHTIPAEVISEDRGSISFLDISPRAPGHAMVVPKYHASTILELSDDEVASIFAAVKRTTDLLVRALRPDGFTIGVNHGRASGQAVDHLHVHIIPRWEGDGGGSLHSVIMNPPRESLEAIGKKIRSHIQ